MEEKKLINEEEKSKKVDEGRVLKSIKECSIDDIQKDCSKVQAVMRKVVTQARGNQPSRTYYSITFLLVPGVCEKTVTLELGEFYNITKSLGLSMTQAEHKNGVKFNTWCRLSEGKTLDNNTMEYRQYWLAEFIVNKMVRKSVFLKELDVDNLSYEQDIKFIKRAGSIDSIESSVEMPIFTGF